MAEPEAALRYSRGAVAFHWSIAFLILVATGLALFRETFGPFGVAMISAHKIVGLLILALSLGRLGWRLAHPPPPFPTEVGRFEAMLAQGVHRLLYALTIAVPLAGWLFTSLAPTSRPLDYRGRETVPELPLAPDDAASYFWHEIHELLGFAMIGLFLLHLAGAARHQYFAGTPLVGRIAGAPARRRLLAVTMGLALALWAVGLTLDLLDIRFWERPSAPADAGVRIP